jgi:cell wall-associated NlpC family hydrolase
MAPPTVQTMSRRAALLAALSMLAACSAPGPVPPAAVVPGREPGGTLADAMAMEVVLQAMSLVDTPYRNGGNTPETGFDCSGLIGYVFQRAASLTLPRTVGQLAGVGREVPRARVRGADLVLFDTLGPLTHAGIYVGGGRFVHAPSTGGRVRLDHIEARYWAQRFSVARRL